MISKQTKKRLKSYVFFDNQVASAYRAFQKDNPEFDAGIRPIAAGAYILRLNWGQYRRKNLSEIKRPKGTRGAKTVLSANETSWRKACDRLSTDELFELLREFDVVSFDIFDTLLYRMVDKPEDVFRIMAQEMNFSEFRRVRKDAENRARKQKKIACGTREITLHEIYEILERDYGIAPSWEDREIDLELQLSIPNPFLRPIYDRLIENGTTVVFTSDMYLPKAAILLMLKKNGFGTFDNFLLSNEYGIRKGDGKLQLQLQQLYPGKTIVHVGDNEAADYEKTIDAGLNAVFNHDQRLLKSDQGAADGDLAGSIYRAVINNNMHCGAWKSESQHYDHGYRVGGILAAGFCEFINKTAKRFNCDKILFCARDCDIISKLYNQFFFEYENSYIGISRYAILQVTADRYLYDFAGRSVIKHANNNRSSLTLETILRETGFDYLVDRLEEYDIEKFLFPQSLKKGRLEEFIFSQRKLILEHCKPHVQAAEQYFKDIIGDARNLLIVDIGWSGTCIAALSYFLRTHFPNQIDTVHGALMATSRNDVLTGSVSSDEFSAYLYSPQSNMDQTRFFMPGGKRTVQELDLIHMPLEYLFTSIEPSLASYALEGEHAVLRTSHRIPPNQSEIVSMQQGMIDFCSEFARYSQVCFSHMNEPRISPYLASAPLREAINDKRYCYSVYKNFVYDAGAPLFDDGYNDQPFGSLFPDDIQLPESDNLANEDMAPGQSSEPQHDKGRILFVSPEMTYTGTPHSLLRISKIAKSYGYDVEAWTAKSGPFQKEFAAAGIPVKCIAESRLGEPAVRRQIKSFDIAICNTIVTDAFVRALEKVIPVVWYIREASNIPDFCSGNPKRLRTLQRSRGITCVSDYAAHAIRQFTAMPIKVVRNAVEDKALSVHSHGFSKDGVVRFVQLGTMEYRKGYDLCIAAYKSLPEDYKKRIEMFFAGGFINSASSYCSYIFSEIDQEPNIHYLGLIKDEDKKNELLANMDVVMVASRDESCSLVALEGAMFSKPLLVTDNVGAKYLVSDKNGIIIDSGSVSQLAAALMYFVDNLNKLPEMGKASRAAYEAQASMKSHAADIIDLIESARNTNGKLSIRHRPANTKSSNSSLPRNTDLVISLTSHPARMSTLHITVQSLLKQSLKPSHLIVWLSKEQFPGAESDLPKTLLDLKSKGLEIKWCSDDIKPHKKYFYAAQQYPESALLIVDDDAVYDRDLAKTLYASYLKHPHAVSCMRANLILFSPQGSFRKYDNWIYDYRAKRDEPSYQLLPTGVGGVLYPPHSIPRQAFDATAIKSNCLFGDDLWLKFFTAANGYPVVVPRDIKPHKTVKGTQDVGLWNVNVDAGANDKAIYDIARYYDSNVGNLDSLLKRLRCIGNYGEWIGADAISYSSLLPNE